MTYWIKQRHILTTLAQQERRDSRAPYTRTVPQLQAEHSSLSRGESQSTVHGLNHSLTLVFLKIPPRISWSLEGWRRPMLSCCFPWRGLFHLPKLIHTTFLSRSPCINIFYLNSNPHQLCVCFSAFCFNPFMSIFPLIFPWKIHKDLFRLLLMCEFPLRSSHVWSLIFVFFFPPSDKSFSNWKLCSCRYLVKLRIPELLNGWVFFSRIIVEIF